MLLVYGPRSTDSAFGPSHPLTPRRFGPGIDLLRAVGAVPGLAPEPASDLDLRRCHSRAYLDVVKRFSADPYGFPEAGIGDGGDNPPFADMHEAAAAVAGGSLAAVEAILLGDVEHAHHPGGGLHHAMRDRAAGFCIYDDPALAIARARADGRRVLYVDLDVHHGDGVQALHWDDPGVLTVSIHESGRTLFPGTGDAKELGGDAAWGTAVNLPLPAGTSGSAWVEAIGRVLPELAATFAPDLIVSQHGADSHAWDPLAHLLVTTTQHGEAARLVDALAHAYAGGRWLATGGGGYDAYRVVPRTWALTWLAGAHREWPDRIPEPWRDRWAEEAERYGQAPLPTRFDDGELEGRLGRDERIDRQAAETASTVRRVVVPRLVREAVDRGWLEPVAPGVAAGTLPSTPDGGPVGTPTIIDDVDRAAWERLSLAPWVLAPGSPTIAHAVLARAIADGASVSAAVVGAVVVGVAVSGPRTPDSQRDLLALGVAPASRTQGLGTTLLDRHLAGMRDPEHETVVTASVTLAERDGFEPLEPSARARAATRLLEAAGFEIEAPPPAIRRLDPRALEATRVLPPARAD
jgi:acetoin utilization protein AcuC